MSRRVVLIVLDSLGVGAAPDSCAYGDEGCNTLAHIARAVEGLDIPHLQSLGLANIVPLFGVEPVARPRASLGRMQEQSPGKDTTTGHWELMGVVLPRPFPTYPQGFPPELIRQFEQRIGRPTLGNIVASGTVIIEELGPEHMETGFPIVYTSADSVFQIAAHEQIIPLEELYSYCRIAREMLQGEHAVGRVIARPFVGQPGQFVRTAHRHDFSLAPPPTWLDAICAQGLEVIGVGKIYDIFAGQGISRSYATSGNKEGMERILQLLNTASPGVIFANLVDFDQLYGHRNDAVGYARALEEFDAYLPRLIDNLGEEDIFIITADHGCDPTAPGTDHTREYVPLLVSGTLVRSGVDLGTRATFADVGASVADFLGVRGEGLAGKSFWKDIRREE